MEQDYGPSALFGSPRHWSGCGDKPRALVCSLWGMMRVGMLCGLTWNSGVLQLLRFISLGGVKAQLRLFWQGGSGPAGEMEYKEVG